MPSDQQNVQSIRQMAESILVTLIEKRQEDIRRGAAESSQLQQVIDEFTAYKNAIQNVAEDFDVCKFYILYAVKSVRQGAAEDSELLFKEITSIATHIIDLHNTENPDKYQFNNMPSIVCVHAIPMPEGGALAEPEHKDHIMSLKDELLAHQKTFEFILKKMDRLESYYTAHDIYIIQDARKNLTTASKAFFEKGDKVDSQSFAEFKEYCEKNIKNVENRFRLQSPNFWNQHLEPLLKGILGVIVAITGTLLTLGIGTFIVASDNDARAAYIHTFFSSESIEEANKIGEQWRQSNIKQAFFGDATKKEKGVIEEMDESINNHLK